jgi:hypothetical protein
MSSLGDQLIYLITLKSIHGQKNLEKFGVSKSSFFGQELIGNLGEDLLLRLIQL